MKKYKIIVSGGGTGGHIFPAISIADRIKERYPDSDVLFVGAEGRMEMDRVPKAGYKIVGLPIIGMPRKASFRFLKFLFGLWRSLKMAKKIVVDFNPDVVVGVGGYASAPLLRAASRLNVPTVLQEQNSYAGKANQWLSKWASAVCVAYDDMDRFFPKDKITLTGNPIRKDIVNCVDVSKEQACSFFGIDNINPTVLILGGSLGAKSINDSILNSLDALSCADANFIWQCGSRDFASINSALSSKELPSNVQLHKFVEAMNMAYACADVIVSRAGASTVSELCLVGKPILLVPSPNVAEDHQKKNALALVNKGAAIMLDDSELMDSLVRGMLDLAKDDVTRARLSKNIKMMARPDAVDKIVDVIIEKSE
ncbi:MAG: undecaprenyldiphospho-muramoylpentapeptide beta-N-acetylglucosaminyltransferase [Bacteroidales bacterium]